MTCNGMHSSPIIYSVSQNNKPCNACLLEINKFACVEEAYEIYFIENARGKYISLVKCKSQSNSLLLPPYLRLQGNEFSCCSYFRRCFNTILNKKKELVCALNSDICQKFAPR